MRVSNYSFFMYGLFLLVESMLNIYFLALNRDAFRNNSNQSEAQTMLLKAKDEQIAAIMSEGESLSRKNVMQQRRLQKAATDLSERAKKIKSLELEGEKQRSEIKSLKSRLSDFERTLKEKEGDNATLKQAQLDMIEKTTSLQKQTEKKDKRIAFLETEVEEKQKEVDAERNRIKSFEQQMKNFEQEKIEATTRDSRYHGLVENMQELQSSFEAAKLQASKREEELQKEIKEKDDLLRSANEEAQKLVSAVPDATRPLLRQIRSLQETADAKAKASTELEEDFRRKIQKLRLDLSRIGEEKTSLQEVCDASRAKINEMESQSVMIQSKLQKLEASYFVSKEKEVQFFFLFCMYVSALSLVRIWGTKFGTAIGGFRIQSFFSLLFCIYFLGRS